MTRRKRSACENAAVAKTSHACRSRRLGDFEWRICLAGALLRSSALYRLILEADAGERLSGGVEQPRDGLL
jgi:hypothetical protein